MTYDEFKQTGKDGVYRPDLDEWFLVGQEPSLATEPLVTQEITPAQEPQPAAPEPVTSTKTGKN